MAANLVVSMAGGGVEGELAGVRRILVGGRAAVVGRVVLVGGAAALLLLNRIWRLLVRQRVVVLGLSRELSSCSQS